jgi:hypothetical protein
MWRLFICVPDDIISIVPERNSHFMGRLNVSNLIQRFRLYAEQQVDEMKWRIRHWPFSSVITSALVTQVLQVKQKEKGLRKETENQTTIASPNAGAPAAGALY